MKGLISYDAGEKNDTLTRSLISQIQSRGSLDVILIHDMFMNSKDNKNIKRPTQIQISQIRKISDKVIYILSWN
jgi:hypothetical protein